MINGNTNLTDSKLHEECGIFGIINAKPSHLVALASSALLALQHRGQESAGIATFIDNKLKVKKGVGLTTDVFTPDFLEYIPQTKVAVGHVRYSTTGNTSEENAQPIETVHPKVSLAMAHNGNLTNSGEIRRNLIHSGMVLHTTNDSEIVNILIIKYMLEYNNIEKAVLSAVQSIEGAFSLVIATKDKLIAVRDRNGFRPLCIGKLNDAVVFSSESCALDTIGATFVRDVAPGEVVTVNLNGEIRSSQMDVATFKRGLCSFELIYFARPDSVIDGVSVYNARVEMGRALYRQRPTEVDLVCGVPDSGLEAARGYSLESGIPLVPAFVKNKYVGRSFILPKQVLRENAVNIKLNPIRATVEGKRIILVDDSIVRSTTSMRIIKMLRNAGAKEVHMRISSPPFKYPCYFGTDVDSQDNLIANKMDIDGICKHIGADSLEYLSIESLRAVAPQIGMCTGCFTGEYPVSTGLLFKDRFDD